MSSTSQPPRSLGSKSRSFIPMTPRSLKAQPNSTLQPEHARNPDGQPPTKKFRASAAPKGSRLARGYIDRAQERSQQQEEDEKQVRLKNLEKLLKDEEIDQATFDRQREELGIGGDVGSTHLVKGLDFKLLERIRRGEDVNAKVEVEPEAVAEDGKDDEVEEVDVDDELEKALERDIEATARKEEDTEPEGPAAETAPVAMSRDEILRQLKERRRNPEQAQTPAQPSLDQSRFKKLEPATKSNKHKFTESINGRRREVLVITNKDGTIKRKTRWLDPEPDPSSAKTETAAWGSDLSQGVIARQKAAVEEAARLAAAEEDDDGDIFADVGEYDPLAGLDSDSEAEAKNGDDKPGVINEKADTDTTTTPASKPLKSTSGPRNYFNTSSTETEEQKYDPRTDPSILAALKRASQLNQQEESQPTDSSTSKDPEDEARNRALLKKLQQQSGQDDIDMDMSFGGDRGFDEEDDEGAVSKQKLSQWKGLGHEDDEGDEEDTKKEKRKRGGGGGGKKKKAGGDKNSFKDVMSVIEGRKK